MEGEHEGGRLVTVAVEKLEARQARVGPRGGGGSRQETPRDTRHGVSGEVPARQHPSPRGFLVSKPVRLQRLGRSNTPMEVEQGAAHLEQRSRREGKGRVKAEGNTVESPRVGRKQLSVAAVHGQQGVRRAGKKKLRRGLK
ncbi:unnamed protein product [Linum trigynum]